VRGGVLCSLFSDCARPRLEGSDVDDWPSTKRIDGPTAPAGAPAAIRQHAHLPQNMVMEAKANFRIQYCPVFSQGRGRSRSLLRR
jgi:hypothetical protein